MLVAADQYSFFLYVIYFAELVTTILTGPLPEVKLYLSM